MEVQACLFLVICHCLLINFHGAVDVVDIFSQNGDNLDILARSRIPDSKVASPFRFFRKLPKVVEKHTRKEQKHSPPSSNTLRKIPKIPSNVRKLESIVNANVKAAATERHLHSIMKSMKTVLDSRIPKLRKISKEKSNGDVGISSQIVHEERIPEVKAIAAHHIFKKVKVVPNPTEQVMKGAPSSKIPREKQKISPSTISDAVGDSIRDDKAGKHLESIVKSMKIILDAKENNAINFKKIPILTGTPVEKASSLPSTNSLTDRRLLRLEDIVRDNIKATVTEKHLDSMVHSMQTVLGAKIPKLRKIVQEEKNDGKSTKKTLESIVRDNLDTAVSNAHLQSISKSMKAVVLTKIPKGGQRSKGESLATNIRVKSIDIPTISSKFETSKIKPEAEHLTPKVESIDFEHDRTLGIRGKLPRQIPGLRTSLLNFNSDVSKNIRTNEIQTNHPASSFKPETSTHARIKITTPSPSQGSGHPVEAKLPVRMFPAVFEPIDDGKDQRETGVNRVRPHKKGDTIRGPFFR